MWDEQNKLQRKSIFALKKSIFPCYHKQLSAVAFATWYRLNLSSSLLLLLSRWLGSNPRKFSSPNCPSSSEVRNTWRPTRPWRRTRRGSTSSTTPPLSRSSSNCNCKHWKNQIMNSQEKVKGSSPFLKGYYSMCIRNLDKPNMVMLVWVNFS